MKRRDFLKLAGLSVTGLAMPSILQATDKAPARKPNIVFILADDLGWMDLSCQGSKFYETPNLDGIAASGMLFTDAYATCPVCSPTRASIVTGKYPARLHLTDYIGGHRAGKMNPAPYIHQIPLEEVTIAEALKEGGYATGFFGKWHLGGTEFHPDKQGFDVNMGGCDKGAPSTYFSPYKIPTLPDGPKGEYLTDRLANEAAKFIEQNKDKPFLVYLSHYAVHNPQQAKEELIEKYKAKAATLPPPKGPEFVTERERKVRQVQNQPIYAAMIQSVDEGVGRITKRLSELGLDQNTIIIFTSDNGGLSTSEGSPTSNLPLRAGKGWPYEGGVREPLLIRWPGTAKPGGICDEPMISTDYYPTILEMAGLPLRPAQHMDGVSLVPLLKGGKMTQRPLFWHYPHYGNQGGAPCGAIRLGDFKLIEWYEDGSVELFNLREDLSEKNNLSAKMPEKVAELRKMLQEWRKSVDATMPTLNSDYKPEGKQHKKQQTSSKTSSS